MTATPRPFASEPGDPEPHETAAESQQQRFEQNLRQDRLAAESECLENADFVGALTNRLRHGVRSDQQHGEEHRADDRNQDRADVADLVEQTFDEYALSGGLGLERGIFEQLVEARGHSLGLGTVGDANGNHANLILAELQRLVEIVVLKKGAGPGLRRHR